MTGQPSSPLVAAVGLVATAADGLRRLPRALGSVGQAAYRRYDELAERGREVLSGHPAVPAAPPAAQPLPEVPGDALPEAVEVVQQEVQQEVLGTPPIGRTEPVVLPEDVLDEVAQHPSGADLGHDELPLADFDHQTVPQLRGRLRSLGVAELVQLRDYEQAHAARMPVLTLLDNRIAKLLADTGQ